METKKFLFLLFVGILIILSLGGILAFQSAELSPKGKSVLEGCNVLYGEKEGATNIVFFSDKKTSQRYADYILEISPYSQNKEAFNFYYIEDYVPKCELYKGIALYCHSAELVKKSASCPNDFIIVISDAESSVRSSAYLNVLSINKNHPLSVFTHEFGHTFASLADEYVPAAIPSGAKNCVKNCESFENGNEGCYPGCSKESFFRSIDSGVMRTLNSKEYGKFNEGIVEEHMKKPKNGVLTGMASSEILSESECIKQNYYLVTGKYLNGEIEILNKSKEEGCLGKNGPEGIFNYSLTDGQNSELINEGFQPEIIFSDEIESGTTEEYSGIFSIKIPIIERVDSIKILRGSEIKAEARLKDIGARACII